LPRARRNQASKVFDFDNCLFESGVSKEKLEHVVEKLKEHERTYKAWGRDREADKHQPYEDKQDKGYIGAKAVKLQGRAVQARGCVAEQIVEPEDTLILDEPTSHQDYQTVEMLE